MKIHHDKEIEPLSKRERDLLAFFITNAGKVLTRDQLCKSLGVQRRGYPNCGHSRIDGTEELREMFKSPFLFKPYTVWGISSSPNPFPNVVFSLILTASAEDAHVVSTATGSYLMTKKN